MSPAISPGTQHPTAISAGASRLRGLLRSQLVPRAFPHYSFPRCRSQVLHEIRRHTVPYLEVKMAGTPKRDRYGDDYIAVDPMTVDALAAAGMVYCLTDHRARPHPPEASCNTFRKRLAKARIIFTRHTIPQPYEETQSLQWRPALCPPQNQPWHQNIFPTSK